MYWISARFQSPNTNVGLFYAAALALALGKSSRDPVLKSFFYDKFHRENSSTRKRTLPGSCANCCAIVQNCRAIVRNCRANVWWNTAWFWGVTIAFVLSFFEWKTKFLISTIFMAVNLLLFLCGFTFYYPRPTESLHRIHFGVFKAAIYKRHLNYPKESNQYYRNNHTPSQFYMNHTGQILLKPKYPFLR